MNFSKIIFLLLIIICINNSCKKEFTNPYDPATDPEIWKPISLTFTQASSSSVLIQWQQGETRIDGFRLERKIGNNNWEILQNSIDKDKREYLDKNVITDSILIIGGSNIEVSYRIAAYAGKHYSNLLEETINYCPGAFSLAGNDQILPGQSTTLLSANNPISGYGNWSIINGSGGSFNDSSNPRTSFVGLENEAYTLSWEVFSDCGISKDTVIISFKSFNLVTFDASDITSNSGVISGQIYDDAGFSIVERGIVYGTTSNPTISDNKISSGSGKGSFSVTLLGLNSITTYYARIYAVYSGGTAYGNEIIFTTTAVGSVTIASITTIAASNITFKSAISGGSISSDGGADITARGIVYSTSPYPSLGYNTIPSSSGTGTFSVSLTNLAQGTKYYIRAYAINSAGTAYGNEVSFFTTSTLNSPVLTSPINQSTTINGTTSYNWNPVAGASSYEINVSRDINFSYEEWTIACSSAIWPISNKVNVISTANNYCTVSNGFSNESGKWYWRVRAKAGTNYGPWSDTWEYTYVW